MTTQTPEKLLEQAAAYWYNDHRTSGRKVQGAQDTLRLDEAMEQELVRQIGLLPEEGQQALFGKYCFRIKEEDLEEALGRNDLQGAAAFYESVLCGMLGLNGNISIDEVSMRKCCEAALSEYTGRIIRDADRAYSKRPSEENKRRAGRRAWKRVLGMTAAAAAVVLVCFSVAFTVNADFRANVLKWFIEDRTEYSVFRTDPEEGEEVAVTIKDLWRYEPTYIPERFTFWDKDGISNLVSYAYLDPDDYYLHITMQMPGSEIMIDTEDMEMEKLEWNGQEAFLYSSEEKGIEFSFILDGFPVYIAGRMNREECFEIAKGIRKNMTPVLATIEEIVTYEPQVIPEQYTLRDRVETDQNVTFTYTDKENHTMTIILQVPDLPFSIDETGMEVSHDFYRGEDSLLVYDEEGNVIYTCMKDGFGICIEGVLDINDPWDMANGIRKKSE